MLSRVLHNLQMVYTLLDTILIEAFPEMQVCERCVCIITYSPMHKQTVLDILRRVRNC